DLRLQRRLSVQKIFGKCRMRNLVVIARVLDDSLARCQRQVQTSMPRVALLEVLYNSQRMQIVIEPQSIPLQASIERAFAGVSERWVAYVVRQCQRLCEIPIEPQRCRHLPRHLRDLDRVRQPAAEVI